MGGYHDRVPTYLPSPTVGALHLGPLAIRGYAVCILLGIVVAVWLTQRRLEVRGGKPGQTLDIATWSVPFGILGGRLYHVITSPDAYFGGNGRPIHALKKWGGGRGGWGGGGGGGARRAGGGGGGGGGRSARGPGGEAPR